ncbi:hypothetical protein [Niastella sp. OAS944]|uniref:hypothetical protein n=1 Tax=Niastella sp. OAS944 TaxID=2664089 RepID=UPI00346A6E1E|nr:hypothetical protein [Chitinophagaceae bacterium OAS944]
MRRTIFYTQTLLFGQEANTSPLSFFISIDITGNHVAFTGASFGHRPTGHRMALSLGN